MVNRAGIAATGFIAIVLCLSCYIHLHAGGAGDKDWLLYAAGQVLNGKTLDAGIIESNPPLIIWLYTLPAAIARLTGLPDTLALTMLGIFMAVLSISACAELLRLHPAFKDPWQRMFPAFLLAFVLIAHTVPSYFADRDHIFLCLTLPYVMRWLPSLHQAILPVHLRVVIGLMAALGFCIKPHDLVLLAGIQLYLLDRNRAFISLVNIENTIISVGICTYLACIWLFTPAYIHTVMPMMAATYGAFAQRMNELIYGGIGLFTLAVAFCEFRPRNDSPYRADIYYLLFICFLCLIYALTNNGWGYSYNPLISYILLTSGWLWLEFGYLKARADDSGKVTRFIFGQRAAAVALGTHLLYTLLFIGVGLIGNSQFQCEKYPACMLNKALLHEIESLPEPRSFVTMSPVVGNWSQLSKQANAAWGTRFNHLWMLPKFISSGATFRQQHEWILRTVADDLAEDLNTSNAGVVFVDTVMHLDTDDKISVNLPVFFSRYPSFKAAWDKYHYEKTLDFCDSSGNTSHKAFGCMFDVYSRLPSAGQSRQASP